MDNFKDKKTKIIVFLLVTLVIVGIVVFFISLLYKDDEEEIKTLSYEVLVNYDKLENEGLDKEVQSRIERIEKVFVDKVDKTDLFKDKLLISNENYHKDKIYTNLIRSDESLKDDDIVSYDLFYYDAINNSIVKLEDIVKGRFYETLKREILEYTQKNDGFYDKKIIGENILNKEFYLIFDKNNMIILFNKKVISDNEVKITIPYKNFYRYLNRTYFTSIKDDDLIDKTRIRDLSMYKDKKFVCITFDDGPGYSNTLKLLDAFNEYDVRASFFMLGKNALNQKDLVRKVYRYGHTIGAHSYDHKNLVKLDKNGLDYQIKHATDILENIIGDEVLFFRPPYGNYNKGILNNYDMSFILWNNDTEDWRLKNADKVYNYLINNVHENDIVLMHDIHKTTVEGVIRAIPVLEEKGFFFVSLEEMAYYKNRPFVPNKAYYSFR